MAALLLGGGDVPYDADFVTPTWYEQNPEILQEVLEAGFGPTQAELAAINQASIVRQAEEQALRQFQANQEQARWAESQIAAQNETTFTEDLAQAYVDFYEGDSTTAALLTDPVGTVSGGAIDVVTDVLGTDVITGSITAAGGAAADILDPITQPLGENLGKLILPAAIIGGALLLLK